MLSIMIVEDDKNLSKLMETVLKRKGYKVLKALDGEEALEVLDHEHVDLMICDIMMPRLDGYQLTDALREADYDLPVLMITAKETLDDKKKGFMAGADDYMVKPVDMDEMILRVTALLRRSKIHSERKLVFGDVKLDYDRMTVYIGKKSILLPKKEFYLLFKLLSNPGKIFTRQQLMDEIWGMDVESDARTVDVHVKRLRDRFAETECFSLNTVRGLGYKAEKRKSL